VGIALLVSQHLTRPKVGLLLILGTLGLTFFIGLSRIFLTVHFVTDMLGGWAAGLGLAFLCAWLDRPRTSQDGFATPGVQAGRLHR
jgi:undecaprenyl-diphosphatase